MIITIQGRAAPKCLRKKKGGGGWLVVATEDRSYKRLSNCLGERRVRRALCQQAH